MPDEWIGEERRRTGLSVCPLHGNIELKLDKIIGRQIAQIKDIAHLKSIVEDGLKTSVIETAECVKKITARIEVIEKFTWFIEWVTQLRDNLFKRSLQLALIGGGIFAIIHFGNKIMSKVLG